MEAVIHPKSIVILDFGGQYAHLLARRVRQCGAYSEILDPETPLSVLRNAAGIILSGGPQSVYDPGSPQGDKGMFDLGIPVLGICYGLQWMTQSLGGRVSSGHVKEYGKTSIRIVEEGRSIVQDCGTECVMWMSHGDEATELPSGFHLLATSDSCTNAAFANEEKHLYAVQFHPEVTHSEHGQDIIRRFVDLCDHAEWSIKSYTEHVAEQVKAEVGDRKVFMLVSGGVDSTVAFTLLNQVLGSDRVQGLLVDTGLMRKNEIQDIEDAFAPLAITNLRVEDASEEFYRALDGVTDPEKKRRIIGDTFLAVQKRVSEAMNLRMEDGWMLGQGTIYPDTIETGGTKHADHIKTHHNRVEAVQKMMNEGLVVEPLKELYKDEVRTLGEELGLPHELVWRHPFPGPGLGVRILCADAPSYPEGEHAGLAASVPHAVIPVRTVGVQGDGRSYRHAIALFSEQPCVIAPEQWDMATRIPNTTPDFNRVLKCLSHEAPSAFIFTPGCITRERADLLREADAIVQSEICMSDLHRSIWQCPVVLLPFGLTEGGQSVVLRPVESQEAMTASATHLPVDLLERMTERILTIDGIDLVFFDLTSKPPATIEWE